jgi:hypothetical protein
VGALGNQLRANGVEAWIDRYVQDPEEGWISWMRSQAETKGVAAETKGVASIQKTKETNILLVRQPGAYLFFGRRKNVNAAGAPLRRAAMLATR